MHSSDFLCLARSFRSIVIIFGFRGLSFSSCQVVDVNVSIIGGVAPSAYLSKLQKDAQITNERTRQILKSHLIDPDALFSDNFEHFFGQREEELIALIETATGKQVARISSQDEPLGEELEDESVESTP